VKRLPEDKALRVLQLIADLEVPLATAQVGSFSSALGFARRYRNQSRTTADWMKELREGEQNVSRSISRQ
jgi:hypothetical protein